MKGYRSLAVVFFLFFIIPLVSADLVALTPPEVIMVEFIGVLGLVAILLAINFVVNTAFVKAITNSFSYFKWVDQKEEITHRDILIITALGLVFDYVAVEAISALLGVERVISAAVFGIIVFSLVTPAAYHVIFKKVYPRKESIYASVIFGTLSNPMWLKLLFGL